MSGRIVDYYDDLIECKGYLEIPESTHPVPLVLVAHTWKGRTDFEDQKVTALNDLGYAALSIDIYGGGVNGQSVEENRALIEPFVNNRELFRQRLISAVDFGKTLEGIDSSKIALIGFCFGGLAAIELARSGYDLSGCISFHGLLNQSDAPFKKVNTKLLVLHGDKDPMVSSDQILALQDEMTESEADWQFISYGNTYHAFTNPGANDLEMGTVYNHDSDMRSWTAMSNFLEEIFSNVNK
ncbi:dienelactone hydrolase family protein [Gammaproteobacteria bacterium]|nr:dienelactone hydrolase family protein [Gammaproteobacteria bacterium]